MSANFYLKLSYCFENKQTILKYKQDGCFKKFNYYSVKYYIYTEEKNNCKL